MRFSNVLVPLMAASVAVAVADPEPQVDSLISVVTSGGASVFDAATSGVGSVATSLATVITTGAGGVISTVTSGAVGVFSTVTSGAESVATGVATTVTSGAGGVFSTVTSGVAGAGSTVVSGGSSVVSAATSAAGVEPTAGVSLQGALVGAGLAVVALL
ncbi:hypothetical protein FKW77_001089 [Venturia effusa]|uniref:Uncharacterized protein n=1 Tax=Venturia effusa TaxID=50376 RepID=A0A517L8J4_9PEZI|nr:hypothetical protein FKW77_001089 [Venturia effusa]